MHHTHLVDRRIGVPDEDSVKPLKKVWNSHILNYGRAVPHRTKYLLLVLFALAGVYVYTLFQTRVRARELEDFAQKAINSIHSAANDVACEFSVSRQFLLFGPTQGKVDVYVRPRNTGENPSIHEVNLYFIRSGGAWRADGSSASASPESHRKGIAVFARRNPAVLQAP